MTQPRAVLLAVLATLAAPLQAQTTPEQWNNLAAGADDFMPAGPETPLDELMTDDFLVPPDADVLDTPVPGNDSVGTAPDIPPAPMAAAPQPEPQGAFPAMDIPADWVEHTRLGVTFRTPPEWGAFEDDDDSLLVGQMDEVTRTGVSFGAGLDREQTFDEMMDGAAVTDLPEVDFGAGVTFRHRSFEGEMDGTKFYGHVLMSTQPYERDKFVMIMSAGAGGDQAATTRQVEMALSTLAVAPFPGEAGPTEAGPQSGFGGLVSYTLPSGWQVFSSRDDFLSFGVTPTYSAYVTIETGDYAQQTIKEGGFDGAPVVARAEILGEPAQLSSGLTPSAEVADGAAMVQGEKRIYLLDRCLRNGDPVVITMVGAPRWVGNGGFEPLIAALSLALPPEAAPCGAPATQAPEQGAATLPGPATAPVPATIGPDAQPTTVSPDGLVIFPAVGLGGWTGENATLKNQHATTGDAKPYLLANASDDGVAGYFVAPPALLGDWRVYGGLRAVLTTAKGAYFGAWDQGGKGDIWIANGTMTASAAFSRPIGSKATDRILRFDRATWTLAGGAASIDDVLARVTDFRIRAEYVRGGTTAALRELAFLPRAAATEGVEPEIWNTVGDVQTQALNSIAAVGNGPGKPSVVEFEAPTLIRSIMTYHWNSARGATPGTIALRDRAGVIYGPWSASGSDGQGGVRNAYWHVAPNISLQPGQYTIIDSDPSTWSTNSETGDRGIFEVRYQRIARVAPSTAP
jgi:hypothetical protein